MHTPDRQLTPRLTRVELHNVRCFEHFSLELSADTPLVLLAGDNAAGKSTLLRSIALGLCRESESAALLKESPGRMVRRGTTEAQIRLELDLPGLALKSSIVTRLIAGSAGEEIVRKETVPDPYAWDELFACAYGTGRGRPATASHERYALFPAVRSLFNAELSLQNPELVLLRQEPELRADLERRLLQILMLEEPDHRLIWNGGGPKVHGPWGAESLPALSDGYRSTTQWLLDLLSWAIQAGRLQGSKDIGGILLIDEVEQHLHPRWQRHILQRLKQQLPGTQIFASTHTPLVVSSTADIPGSRFLSLSLGADGRVETTEIDTKLFYGQRADQILASEAFDLPMSRNPGAERALAALAQPGAETSEMGTKATNTNPQVQPFRVGTTPIEQKVEAALEKTLREIALPAEGQALSEEGKRQLRALFGRST